MKISVEDRVCDLLSRFCVEAAAQDPFVRLFVQGVYKRSPQKISVRDVKVRSPSISVQALQKISLNLCSLHQFFVHYPYRRSPGKIAVQALKQSSLGKIYVGDLLARSLQQILMQCLRTRSAKEVS